MVSAVRVKDRLKPPRVVIAVTTLGARAAVRVTEMPRVDCTPAARDEFAKVLGGKLGSRRRSGSMTMTMNAIRPPILPAEGGKPRTRRAKTASNPERQRARRVRPPVVRMMDWAIAVRHLRSAVVSILLVFHRIAYLEVQIELPRPHFGEEAPHPPLAWNCRPPHTL
jgi:hypothetical protein